MLKLYNTYNVQPPEFPSERVLKAKVRRARNCVSLAFLPFIVSAERKSQKSLYRKEDNGRTLRCKPSFPKLDQPRKGM